MDFRQTGVTLIVFLIFGIIYLLIDLVLFVRKRTTFSEAIWKVNQFSLALAFIFGLLVGHLFTVPGLP